jgi:hypothetical protein
MVSCALFVILDVDEQIDTTSRNKLTSNESVVLALPFGVGALEVFYAVFVEDPEAGGYFVDEVVVVGD